MTDLAPNELVIAVRGDAAAAALTRLIKGISGQSTLFRRTGPVGDFEVDLAYSVYDVSLRFHSPLIVFDKLIIDTTFYIHVGIDWNGLYDSISILPPRCIKICVPFTSWCYTKCINLGTSSFTIPVPISFNAAGTYQPSVDTSADEFTIYPNVVSITPFIIDPVRIIQRLCAGIASLLPWPLSIIADKFCDLFASIFGFFEDALVVALNNLVTAFFDATGGWMGLQIRQLKLYSLSRHAFPGTGVGGTLLIPAQLDNLEADINSADELQADVLVLPPA